MPRTPGRDLAPLDKLDFDLEDKHPTQALPTLAEPVHLFRQRGSAGSRPVLVSFQYGVLRTNGVALGRVKTVTFVTICSKGNRGKGWNNQIMV